MIRAATIVGFLVAGGQAIALSPPLPTCYAPDGPEAMLDGYEPLWLGNGFVRYEAWLSGGSGDQVVVLEYCPTARQLVLTLPASGAGSSAQDDMVGLFDSFIESETPYTMEQMRDGLAVLGAEVRLGDAGYLSCACATFADQ